MGRTEKGSIGAVIRKIVLLTALLAAGIAAGLEPRQRSVDVVEMRAHGVDEPRGQLGLKDFRRQVAIIRGTLPCQGQTGRLASAMNRTISATGGQAVRSSRIRRLSSLDRPGRMASRKARRTSVMCSRGMPERRIPIFFT